MFLMDNLINIVESSAYEVRLAGIMTNPSSATNFPKSLLVGKLAVTSVRPWASQSLLEPATMFGLSFLSLLNPPKKRSECGTNQLGQPQARQLNQSSQNSSVAFCESDRSWAGFGAHVSSTPPQIAIAEVYRTDTTAPSLFKSVEVSDEVTRQSGCSIFLPEAKALPFQWVLTPRTKITLHERIMARLIQAQAHEPDAWYRQDYGQAFVCVSLAQRGNTEPFLASSYTCYGLHPDKVWPAILHNRRARLASEYSDFYDAAGNLKPDAPKKPSVPSPTDQAAERSTNERLAALIQKKVEGL